MKAKVDEDVCTGCGLCEDTCPEVFEVKDGIATVKEEPVATAHEEACEAAVDGCPVEAITIEE